ncbi:TKL protein kinase [Phytophthora cinnamomi]|uniref:TKL protein kinase n=1 Tax=Phytophthora cinnamomi TaxID=4785 RepID=UPI003559EB4E|nr:TKL protein kinase [Phytophthora cinnamomi]
MHHMNEFLSEAKMTATIEHMRIVRFVGVVWDLLSDLCVVLEFMDGGDLHSLLDRRSTCDLAAKLTDVGISRERLDRTMTAGVGTSRWMAPEVMLEEINDVKADVFSFGVLLSELDVHSLQHTFVKVEGLAALIDSDG